MVRAKAFTSSAGSFDSPQLTLSVRQPSQTVCALPSSSQLYSAPVPWYRRQMIRRLGPIRLRGCTPPYRWRISGCVDSTTESTMSSVSSDGRGTAAGVRPARFVRHARWTWAFGSRSPTRHPRGRFISLLTLRRSSGLVVGTWCPSESADQVTRRTCIGLRWSATIHFLELRAA
jgi:hypothetical protein